MQHVDSLSRNPVEKVEESAIVADVVSLYNTLSEADWLTLLQQTDPAVNKIVKSLKSLQT